MKPKDELSRAIFIDRDGVINKWTMPEPPHKPEDFYITSWDQFEFLPGVFEAFSLLDKGEQFRVDYDYRLIVISNQSGIGQGVVDEDPDIGWDIVDSIFSAMESKIQKETGVWIEYMFCPHAPDAGCACRKPKPGMIYKYAVDYNLDLSKCWMIGDQVTDMEAGIEAGMTNLLLVNDKIATKKIEHSPYRTDEVVETHFVPCPNSLLDAIKFIISCDESNTSS